MKPQPYDNKKQRVRLMLLSGKVLTKKGLDRKLDVTNSAEIIRQLRKEMPIKTDWKKSKNGVRHGEYSYIPSNKESRVVNRAYIHH